MVGWQADGSHDGYLDLMLGVGVPGALYYVLLSGRTIFLAFRYARFDMPEFKWFLLFSAAMFILNIDEGTLPGRTRFRPRWSSAIAWCRACALRGGTRALRIMLVRQSAIYVVARIMPGLIGMTLTALLTADPGADKLRPLWPRHLDHDHRRRSPCSTGSASR
ncbi:MAG: hypothetical protein WDN69_12755 [Aliidongia sp.]